MFVSRILTRFCTGQPVLDFTSQRMNMSTKQAREQFREAALDWYGRMLACVKSLSPDERAAFDKWDAERPEGVATSDWPGFDKYLPRRPWSRETVN
jgi:hypothetical protein